MRLPKLNSLYGRIFAIFWFTILLVLIAVLSLPHLDPRKSRDLPQRDLKHMVEIKDMIETKFAGEANLSVILNDLLRPTNRSHAMNPSRPMNPPRIRKRFFLTNLDGDILLPEALQHPNLRNKALKNFISSIRSIDHPQQRLYGRYMIMGPLPIRLAQTDLLLYIGVQTNHSPPFIFLLLDNPITFLLMVMLISTPLLLWLSWALSQPSYKLALAAQRVARGEFQVDETLEQGTSESRLAGQSFNRMVEAVNGMISGQQRLLSDISHELRSPLTRLRMANALATRKQGQSAELERIDTEAQRLEQMIGELLELSRMQINSHMSREVQPLSSLWETLLDDAVFEAEQMAKKLTYTPIPNQMISGNPKLLMSALENIVRNAIYYGQDQIQVSFVHTTHQLIITVEDNGNGVPEEELKDIFRPFYRVSASRNRHSGGSGLGLAITESAIRQHNGTIQACASQMGGLKVIMTLPLST